MKNSMTPAGVKPATFRFVAQQLNHCATAVQQVHEVPLSIAHAIYHTLLLTNMQFNDGISGLGYIAMSHRVINEQ